MPERRLEDSVQFVKGVGPRRAEDFRQLGVETVRDLLFTFPRRISDRSQFLTIAEAGFHVGEEVALRAMALESSKRRIRGGRTLTTVTFDDGTGALEGVWFNAPWILEKFDGQDVLLFGKLERKGNRLQMVHPRVELVAPDEESGETVGRMVPIYPLRGSLTQAAWRKVVATALDQYLPLLEEFYPGSFLAARGLLPRAEAVRQMHFPESAEAEQSARERLVYDECLIMQLGIAWRRYHHVDAQPGRSFRIPPKVEARIRALLPFRLTGAQERAAGEVLADMRRDLPMNRLLQGDVGSGKTAVALYAALAAVADGAQVVLMAPTEILARQHERTVRRFLERSRKASVRVGLLVGGMKRAARQSLLAAIGGGAVDIVVGTHAALQEDVGFADLGLAIIDEQHKFGVAQRLQLRRKGRRPDVLVMTATPIPRSLALTLYGDLDVSVIDELPPGRKPVRTHAPPPASWPKVYDFLRQQLTAGRQAYIVCPLVEESEDSDLRSATAEFERLQAEDLAGYRLGLLHGQMKREEQITAMEAFREGRLDALVSTVVIEVGVDVPNATLLLVLHAERFGLAQLHQLRGRIGRGAAQGHCILLSEARQPAARERLEILVREHDGFRIAEEDLRLRGEGEFFGTRQHGRALRLTNLVEDYDTLAGAREDARGLLKADPELTAPSHKAIREELLRTFGDRLALGGTG